MADAIFHRALVIRGGALGDFLLTLPTLDALREACPPARLELLAYPAIAELAVKSGSAHAVRSIEYGPLARFFTRDASPDSSLCEYFASFDLVVSYLYDPDGIFAENLRATGVRRLIAGPHRPTEGTHAIDQLARPLSDLRLPLVRRAIRWEIAPKQLQAPLVAIHPGSGSASKNWPPQLWHQLAVALLEEKPHLHLAIIGGEADATALAPLRELSRHPRLTFWENLPLGELSSRLAGAGLYVGHDTGVSHLAAVVGTPSLLLFGPTNPAVWAPPHDHVQILAAPDGNLTYLPVSTVRKAVERLLPAA